MPKQKTNEEFLCDVLSLPHGKDYTFLQSYINARIKILVRHDICGHEWMVKPQNFLAETVHCPNCNPKRAKTNEEFIREVFNLVGYEYTFIDKYINNSTKLKVIHNLCENIFYVSPNMFLSRGCRCPPCVFKDRNAQKTKSNEKFLEDLYKIHKNDFTPLESYAGALTKIKFVHNECGNEILLKPNTLLNGSGCGHCSKSKGEKRIRNFLIDHKIKFEEQKEYNDLVGTYGKPLRYDFYLNDYKILCEYQGQFHDGTVSYQTDKDIEIQKEHDKRKANYAENNNIELFEIWYCDFDNIEKVLKDKLKL